MMVLKVSNSILISIFILALFCLTSVKATAQQSVTISNYKPTGNGFVLENIELKIQNRVTYDSNSKVIISVYALQEIGRISGYKYKDKVYPKSPELGSEWMEPQVELMVSGTITQNNSPIASFANKEASLAGDMFWESSPFERGVDKNSFSATNIRIVSTEDNSVNVEIQGYLDAAVNKDSNETNGSPSNISSSSNSGSNETAANQRQQNDRKSGDSYENGEEISIPAPVINPTNNRVIDDEMLGFLNSTANDSKNPRFKKMVEEFNSYRSNAAQQKSIIGSVKELSQSDYDEYNMAENLAQAVSVGKFIFTSIFNKKEKNNSKKEDIITPQQREASKTISDNSKELRSLFDEVRAIPTFYEFNDKTLAELENYEAKIKSYERVTATRRLLFWKYINYEGRMDIKQLGSVYNQILDVDKNNGREHTLNMIDESQNDFKNKEDVLHMLNAEEGFKGTLNKIQHIRALCYENAGHKNEAEKIRSGLTYNVTVKDAIKLIQSTFKNNNYYGSIEYYQPVKEYFTTNDEVEFIYLDLPNLNLDMDGLSRMDATYLLGLGVLSHIRSGEISQAREELDFLKNFQDQLQSAYEDHLKIKARKKYYKISDTEYKSKVSASKSIVLAVESAFNNKLDNSEEALQIIDQAIRLYDEGSIGASMDLGKKYKLWMLLLKAEILIKIENFEEAKELTRIMKNQAKLSFTENENFDMDELRFLSAYIRFKEQDYRGTLFALKLLKKSNPDVAKYYALEEDVYKAMGDQVSAEKARQSYIQTLTKN